MKSSLTSQKKPVLTALSGWMLVGGLSLAVTACSGAIGVEDDPESDDLPLEDGPGAAMSSDADDEESDGATPATMPPALSMEGNPSPSGLDTSGAAADSDAEMTPTELDEAEMMSLADPEVPDSEHCAAVADWDPEWVQFEEEVLLLVNEFRAQTADCGVEGIIPAAAPLVMDPILRCSARLHSLDMFERDYFEHTNPDGVDPFQRMDAAGFVGSGGGENIAVGQVTPEQVMQSWMDSDGHCANVMRENFTMLGVGFHPGAGRIGLGSNYWTQNFGAPPFMRGGGRNR